MTAQIEREPRRGVELRKPLCAGAVAALAGALLTGDAIVIGAVGFVAAGAAIVAVILGECGRVDP